MKKYAICLSTIVLAGFVGCRTHQKVAYEFPTTMSIADREKFTHICNKGQVLYAMNCSSCHNVRVKRRSIVPDFTQDQMSRYELKSRNMQHDTSEAFTSVTPEEMSDIYLYLTYKQRSKVPLVLPNH